MNDNSIDWQMSMFKRFWFVGAIYLVCFIACLGSGEWYSILTALSAGFFLAMVIAADYYFFKYKRECKFNQERYYCEKKGQKPQMQDKISLEHLITIEGIENIAKYHGYYLQKGNDGEIVFQSNGHGNIFYDNHRMILQQNIIYHDTADYSIALQAAAKATNGIMMAKIKVIIPPDNPFQIGITISVETIIHYIDELKINFSRYLEIMQDAEDRFVYEYCQIAENRQSQNTDISQTDTQKNVIIN